MDTQILEEIGLQKDEIQVYLILLKLGSVTATKMASETNIYRTNVYRILESLMSKGLVNHILRNNVKYFSAASPKKILEDYKKRQESLATLIPQLESLSNLEKEEFKVEVFKGKEGIIAVLKYVLRERKNYLVFGEEGKFQEILPFYIDQLLRDIKKSGISERILSKEEMKGKIKLIPTSKIRYLPNKYFSPSMTVVFGDYLALFIWNEPYQAVLIKSKSMAQSYKSYFEVLWKTAKR